MIEKLDDIIQLIPLEEYERIMGQSYCELEPCFMGFTEVYKSLLGIIPKHYTVVDLGCYVAPQSYLFKDYKKYIGIDVCNLERFNPSNAEHFVCSIQDFIQNEAHKLDLDETFAICSYVPDDEATKLARECFKNIMVYYPHGFTPSILKK